MIRPNKPKSFDVIVVGAGLIGLTLARSLAQQELKVAVVESKAIELTVLEPAKYQLRVSALNLNSIAILNKLDLWRQIVATGRPTPFEKMTVWDSLGRGEIHFNCTDIAQSYLGFIVENAVISNELITAQDENLQFFANQQPKQLSLVENGIELQLANKQSLRAQLLIGADGAHSWVRQQINLTSYHWSYHQQALVTTVKTEAHHQRTAWQCFLADGPLALLPLADPHSCSIVWSGSPLEIQRRLQLDEQIFKTEISQAFEYRLGKINTIAPKKSFPLAMNHAKKYVTTRVALVGDAAHTIHPLAGQGVNLGFADLASLVENITLAREKTGDCGSYPWLRKYERSRKEENWAMVMGMEGLKRLFETELALPVSMRSRGLNWVDKSNFLKNIIIKRAMGTDFSSGSSV